jgi:surfactin synthase thioesterase subunit
MEVVWELPLSVVLVRNFSMIPDLKNKMNHGWLYQISTLVGALKNAILTSCIDTSAPFLQFGHSAGE